MWHQAQVVWSRGSVRLHTGELIGAGAGGVGLFSVSKNSLPSWSDRVFLATRAPKMLKHHKTEKRKKVTPPGGGMPPRTSAVVPSRDSRPLPGPGPCLPWGSGAFASAVASSGPGAGRPLLRCHAWESHVGPHCHLSLAPLLSSARLTDLVGAPDLSPVSFSPVVSVSGWTVLPVHQSGRSPAHPGLFCPCPSRISTATAPTCQ